MSQLAPVTIASIDAGSNAIRMQISAIVGGELVALESERVAVRLGSNAFTVGELNAETMDAAVSAFHRFRKLFDYHGVEHYRAVATSATRTVRNRETLLSDIYYQTGITLEVIDGEEEFRLVRDAVVAAMAGQARPPYLVDLGGGSLEVGYEVNGEWESISLPVGTVRMMESFGLTGAISDEEERMVRRLVRGLLVKNGIASYRQPDAHAIVATGGNAEALARLFGTERDGVWVLSRRSLEQALAKLLPMPESAREVAWGIRRDRAEVIGIAGIVFLVVMELLEVDELLAPCVGVREGILRELRDQQLTGRGAVSTHASLVGGFRMLAQRLGHDIAHGEDVRRMALRLFDGLAALHRLPPQARKVLELAALVHDIGEVIDRKAHHRHSEYIVLHGRVPGLTSPLREQVAALSRAHRKSWPEAPKHGAYAKLSKEDRLVVDRLVPILRIADALDTNHRDEVRGISLKREGDGWVIVVHATRELHMKPLARRNADFLKGYGVPVSMALEVTSSAAG